MYMMHGGGMFMGGMHWIWWIFWVLLFCAFVYIMWSRPDEHRRRLRDTPHQTLQRRLANGDITPEEYETRKTILDRDTGAKT